MAATRIFFSSARLRARTMMKKVEIRVSWRQCNTSDTVPSDDRQAQSAAGRVPKMSIILNVTVVTFQRLN
jgi:hypothetical protein